MVTNNNKLRGIKGMHDLTLVLSEDSTSGHKELRWHHFTPTDELYMGSTTAKTSFDAITLDECIEGLQRVPDEEVFPEVPAGVELTIAPDDLDPSAVFVKRTRITKYEGPGSRAHKALLNEALAMERISRRPHPYIVRYLGCRVFRGRITGIVLERVDGTLEDVAYERPAAEFAALDKERFLAGLESAVRYLHSLDLVHCDISPDNVGVRAAAAAATAADGPDAATPVLLDFDGCKPVGSLVECVGTPGFFDEVQHFKTDRLRNLATPARDIFSLGRLREWWDTEKTTELHYRNVFLAKYGAEVARMGSIPMEEWLAAAEKAEEAREGGKRKRTNTKEKGGGRKEKMNKRRRKY